MISIISLLALIMYSHVVVSQRYRLQDVRSHASAAGAESHNKRLSYEARNHWIIEQDDCLQVREKKTIIYNFQLAGETWSGGRVRRIKDPTIEDYLDREGYPKTGRSVWRATPHEGRGCADAEYRYEESLIGHAKKREPGRRDRSAVTLKKPKISKTKKVFGRFKRKDSEPKTIEIHNWHFEPDKSTGKKTLYHRDLSRAVKEEIHSFKSGECIVVQAKDEDYEFKVYCLNDGKWAEERGIPTEYADDVISSELDRLEREDPVAFELWVKTRDGPKEVKERVFPSGSGTATAAADAYVEYEDEMDGFASKYDGLLAEFEYDVEVEEAREKKAMTHLAKEKYDILRAKNRKNKY